jgi:Domain of unknown function (DUF4037)
MSVLVEGSVGLGLHDRWSDLEATIYLDDPLWLEQGGQLQLLMMHGLPAFSARSEPHCAFPGEPHKWPISGHPEINVHPVSWLLDHHANEFLAANEELPWEAVSVEALYALQHDLVLCDSSGVLGRLRDATTEARYPPWLWEKRLIFKLHDLKGEPLDFEKAVMRGDIPAASIVLGTLLQGLLEIGFLSERRYYPWRKHLWRAYRELPISQQMLPDLGVLATGPDWTTKVKALGSLVDRYADAIIERGILTSEMLEDLPAARSDAAWSDPAWRAESRRLGEIALRAGFDVQDGWVWGLWRWA